MRIKILLSLVLCGGAFAEAPPSAAMVASQQLPFTGKVKGERVRLRLRPDVESPVVRELSAGQFLLVVDAEGDFYAVCPPADTHYFVFGSYVRDGAIAGERVNARLRPDRAAPI